MDLVYLTDIIILLTAAVIIVPLSRFVGLGIVPGFLIAGVIVGPSALGLIDNPSEIGHLAELGVVLLLFVIGIELKPSRLWLMRRLVFGLGALQVVLTGVLLSAIAFFMFGIELQTAVLVGPALALSSTAFVLQLLTEQKMLTSRYGRSSLAVLLFQDLAVIPLLALASLITVADISVEANIALALLEALIILTLVILGGRYLLQPVLHRVARLGSPEIFTASAVLLVMGTAVLMASIGLSMALGAFIAGLLVADSEFRHQVMAEIQPFRGLLIGLFFMSMGMSLEIAEFLAAPLEFIGLVLILIVVKILMLWPLVRLFGHKGKLAMAVALLLAQSGEFALVLFAVMFDSALLTKDLFNQLLVVVVLSMLATPPLARLAHSLVIKSSHDANSERLKDEEAVTAPVMIIGFGRVGRRIGQILEMRTVPYVAIDFNADVVHQQRRTGRSVFYGDARRPDALKSMGIGNADLAIVTVDDFKVTEQLVSSIHGVFPTLKILARGHDLEHCQKLSTQGAWFAVCENLEASIALAQAALTKVLGEDIENHKVTDQFRQAYNTSPIGGDKLDQDSNEAR